MKEFLTDYVSNLLEIMEIELNETQMEALVNRIMNDDATWDSFDCNIRDIMNEMEVK
jgi:hypothetical protein